jgi:cation diffusion facilitator CzcD-associated flavoprotein CzcO
MGSDVHPDFVSPMYDELETNLPHCLMQYSDFDFPSDSQLFPHRDIVLQYLEEYAREVRHMISFDTQVLDVSLKHTATHDRWRIKTRALASQHITESIYDGVVVASGHYDVPLVPQIPGLMAWNTEYPNSVIHSKAFRSPERFRDKYELPWLLL